MDGEQVYVLQHHARAMAHISQGYWKAMIDLYRETHVEEVVRMELLELGEKFWATVENILA